MNKIVKCPACGEGYNLDLDKYGGKKIKCKKCQGIIAVPTAAEAQDEFEVVEETPTAAPVRISCPNCKAVLQAQPGVTVACPNCKIQMRVPLLAPQQANPAMATLPSSVPPSILQRNRMASQRGAVNIALLQRNEPSKEEIRRAFLAVHGSEDARAPALAKVQAEIATFSKAMAEHQQTVMHLKNVLADIPIPEWGDKNTRSFGIRRSQTESAQHAFKLAVRLLGKPTRKLSIWEEMNPFNTQEDEVHQKTIEAAIKRLEDTNLVLKETLAALTQDAAKAKALLAERCRTELSGIREQITSRNFSDASLALQEMLKAAPVAMLGEVLIALSKCTYWSGNASDAARHIQDAICFGASAPVDMDEGYNGLWAKASAGLPKV